MKLTVYFLLCLLLLGCTNQKREQELQHREARLNQKEQELLLKEKQLQLREQKLQLTDSTELKTDSVTYNPDLPGTWSVNMICTETDCPGSAIGDTKNEQWEISYQNGNVLAKAMVNNKLVRVYSGAVRGNTLELSADPGTDQPSTKMIVKLQQTTPKRWEGRREIIRQEGCRIIYSMLLSK